MMNHTNTESYYERLRSRRDKIRMTHKYMQKEERVVDENKDWIDHAAYESRVDLFNELADWYTKETARIDDALIRIAAGTYGVCLACHASIEVERLEIAPEATFCAECQKSREGLTRL